MNGAGIDGTKRYIERFKSRIATEHYHTGNGWLMSSLGLGTYLGDADSNTDQGYQDAATAALSAGCNVIDTAINYRHQRSERSVGAALKTCIEADSVLRDEVILSTKGGFLPFDGDFPPNPARYIKEQYVDAGICRAEDIVGGMHCMAPDYLENQLSRSLRNLQVDCIDIYFIHNPETQLGFVTRQDFLRRMLAAFRMLEQKVQEGKIQVYGTATWDGYRVPPQARSYLSLEELVGLARNAGGEEHHFRAIQLPYNLAMPEAYLNRNQNFGPEVVSAIEAAKRYGMIVMTSASIMQGQLASGLPQQIVKFFPGLSRDSHRAIQFARSTPGVTSALVGMSQVQHVKENLNIATIPPLPENQLAALFGRE